MYCLCYSTTIGKIKWNSCTLIQTFYVRAIPNIHLTVVFWKTHCIRLLRPSVTGGSLEALWTIQLQFYVGLAFSILPAPWQQSSGCSGLLSSTIQAHLTSQVCAKASGPKSFPMSVRLKCIPAVKHKARRIFPLKYLLLSLSHRVTFFFSKLGEKSD